MPTQFIKVFEGFTTEADADLAGIGLRLEGYTTTVTQEANGTYTLTATKKVDQASNAVDGFFEESDQGSDYEVELSSAVKGLLDFIASFESGGNYNAYYNNSGNQNSPKFTSMTLKSVREWQDQYVNVNGSKSSAVGRYQIIRSTFDLLVDELNLDASNTRFTQDTQDLMAKRLLERRGLQAFLRGDDDTPTFGNSLAKEWAALPVLAETNRNGITIARGDSYYSGVGGNKALAAASDFEAQLQSMLV